MKRIELEKFMEILRRGEEKKKIIILVVSFYLFIILDLIFFLFGLYINKSERRYETTKKKKSLFNFYIFSVTECPLLVAKRRNFGKFENFHKIVKREKLTTRN